MKKLIIISLLLIALLTPKAGLASTLEIQILQTRIQILQLQIQYLITLLSEARIMNETQQAEIKEIEQIEIQETIKPIIEEEVKEEIKQPINQPIVPPFLEECLGRACA